MESRTAFRGEGISKGIVALLAVIVVLGLGVMAGFVAKSATGPAAGSQSLQVATQSAPCCEAVDSFDGSGYGVVP
ncbi:MAG: hypothetical protein NVS1B3_00330 [Candidatus Dormibacteraceae bacterium]